MKYNDNGLVIYEGESMLDKSTEIIAILTGVISPSKNAKTGDMAQLWIMVKDVNPFTAIQTGEDNVVCGDCPLRGKVCYVNTTKAPLKIWEAYQKRALSHLERNNMGTKIYIENEVSTPWCIRRPGGIATRSYRERYSSDKRLHRIYTPVAK